MATIRKQVCLPIILGICCLALTPYFLEDTETLIVFVADTEPLIAPHEIDSLEALAKVMNLQFKVHNAADGLPPEVTTLPSIYFQNRKGRSRYYGRYTNIDRIRNFVRTCKMVHKKNEATATADLLVWKSGKADMAAPLKISPLAGTPPDGFDAKVFKKEVGQQMAAGMNTFQLLPSHEVTPYTRSFYVNVYPYVSENGDFALTGELFSQYNCIAPIFTQLSPPIAQADWKKRGDALQAFGKAMEAEILQQIKTSKKGDAFKSVPTDIQLVSWKSMGLEMGGNSDENTTSHIDFKGTLPQKWTVEQRSNTDEPIIIFSFLSPVDNYAGEVKALSGDLALGENGSMSGAKGKFEIQISDVTMGAEDFDNEVQNKMLKMGMFPNAHFEFVEIVEGGDTPLTIGKAAKCVVKGNFTMLGISIPIHVETEIEPIADTNETLKLVATCAFELPLFDKFKVEGPDGPSPAKDVLQFFMKFNLIPQ